jgi:hypothetical protein
MGRAILPDPLDETTSTSASADDLLLQLAGEEIDRLLAESESEPHPVAAASQPLADPHESGTSLITAHGFASVPPASGKAGLKRSTKADTADFQAVPGAEISADWNAAFAAALSPVGREASLPRVVDVPGFPLPAGPLRSTQAISDARVAAEEMNSISPSAQQPAIHPDPEADIGPMIDLDFDAAERAALRGQAVEISIASKAMGKAVPAAVCQPRGDAVEDKPLPLLLRPLEWLNAPLVMCSERVREALGKVAIVTLVNAVAVLLYVILFRKH